MIRMKRQIAQRKVGEVMTKEAVTVTPDTDIRTLKALFEKHDYNNFPVVDGEDAVGVVSKLDLLNAFCPGLTYELEDVRRMHGRTVSDIMTANIISVGPNDPVSKAANMMVEYKLRSLLVTENGRLKGIISRNDIIRCLEIG